MRFLASILFALMAFILPTAGVTRNFCTISMGFVTEDGKCQVDGANCCCKDGKQQSSQPDCMIAAKPLPNADKTPAPHIPVTDSAYALLKVSPGCFPPTVEAIISAVLSLRGPPLIPDPLYITQRRLLI